ncbi:putative calcium-binding protein CML46 [Curcuma longa]|uniref:putative calcium-binding protein CML46 n=1 Tax=Curcuma longa TaxID=136217 RepID=UPI003D9E7C0A
MATEKKLLYFSQGPASLPFIYKLLLLILITIKKFSLKYFALSFSCPSILDEEEKQHHQRKQSANLNTAAGLQRGDLGLILWRMGLAQSPEGEVSEEMDLEVLLPDLFTEDEPSWEELRQAFSVFDENGDGFIDDLELRKVLRELGIGEGLEVDACRRMIRAQDRDGDGRIDFSDFVRFLEVGLC